MLNLLINIVIPALVLMRLSSEEMLGPVNALLLALVFPIGYAIYEFSKERKVNFIPVLGFFSILLTGGIGLFQLDPAWIAVKEAAVPAIIGIAVSVSMYTPYPLVEKLVYNDKILDKPRIEELVAQRGGEGMLRKLLHRASWLTACSFFLSSLLNYVLARAIVKSAPGTEAFNEELGQMTALSFPVIALPSTIVLALALWYLLSGIRKMTGLEWEEMIRQN